MTAGDTTGMIANLHGKAPPPDDAPSSPPPYPSPQFNFIEIDGLTPAIRATRERSHLAIVVLIDFNRATRCLPTSEPGNVGHPRRCPSALSVWITFHHPGQSRPCHAYQSRVNASDVRVICRCSGRAVIIWVRISPDLGARPRETGNVNAVRRATSCATTAFCQHSRRGMMA